MGAMSRKERKAAKMEAMGRKKRKWWEGGGYENAVQKAIREATEGSDDDSLDYSAELSESERQEILNTKVAELVRRGYQLQHKDSTSASLVNPAADPMGIGGFVMGICTLGLSWVFLSSRRGKENDKPVYVEVKPNGVVETTGKYGTSQDHSHVPRLERE